jgi:hypothetical protein
MLEAKQSTGWSRGQVALAVALAAAAIVLAFGIRASAAQACVASSFCSYTGESFGGGEVDWGCKASVGESTNFGTEYRSAKNACGGQYYEIGWTEAGSTNWKSCLNPGEQRAAPGRWNTYWRVASC